ncbi:alpha-L-arabinofuranosidase C-terminal domain-containing protein [Liquorilactobacillus nagelii]|uniref:alpha-L-arabinofuranosidase C-terminal domain-containing protein n=1 Tax=Liquorilactobacillus nagelii TaxID=82688 RepID=UPI00070A97BE|nr:alpha-L-arabinofuranosidase C-terminal domain-containing protein [Liquorilactobacillus nagelii]QYH55288.1 alpha-L-arabinofuranosidase [Liquorilactobacillus nagelii DSM 13675]
MKELLIDTAKEAHDVSQKLYGIFIEDINFACDGGLNANKINNYSFDGYYFDRQTKKGITDYLRYWNLSTGKITSESSSPLNKNSRYARINVSNSATLENLGYNGGKKWSAYGAYAIDVNKTYQFSGYFRSKNFQGDVFVEIVDQKGKALTTRQKLLPFKENWQFQKIELNGIGRQYGKLKIYFIGNGVLDLDCLSFFDLDYWNNQDPKWRYGRLRKDLVMALQALKPKFVRFPGGCIVEGNAQGNEYNWKNTVGPLYSRKADYSLWGEKIPDGGYNQSFQIGFYEYFCLCEDLKAQPLPTLYAGLNCQLRSKNSLAIDSNEFKENVIQNYLDLIEFANGNPELNKWAALRARMGHPAAFGLKMIGIGNENYGKDYLEKFERIKQAIQLHYPQMVCILSAGFLPFKHTMRPAWKLARNKYPDLIVDEHSYHSPGWFQRQAHRFDKYQRNSAKAYFGEYAANGLMAGRKQTPQRANTFWSALSEAAFLTGIERNSDVVEMASYAPLFNLVSSEQWNHNLIDFNPQCYCPTANYLVQKLFSNNLGTKTVITKGKVPLKIYYSVTRDDKKLFIKLVNCSCISKKIKLVIKNIGDTKIKQEFLGDTVRQAKNGLNFFGQANENLRIRRKEIPITDGNLVIILPASSLQVLTVKLN